MYVAYSLKECVHLFYVGKSSFPNMSWQLVYSSSSCCRRRTQNAKYSHSSHFFALQVSPTMHVRCNVNSGEKANTASFPYVLDLKRQSTILILAVHQCYAASVIQTHSSRNIFCNSRNVKCVWYVSLCNIILPLFPEKLLLTKRLQPLLPRRFLLPATKTGYASAQHSLREYFQLCPANSINLRLFFKTFIRI